MIRIVITGGPKTGKTTMANKLSKQLSSPKIPGPLVKHTDDLIPLGWSAGSEAASKWFDDPGPWIVEGVAVSRALRKWCEAHPGQKPPVDRVIYLCQTYMPTTRGQDTMAKGVEKVHGEINGWLLDHGIKTEYL